MFTIQAFITNNFQKLKDFADKGPSIGTGLAAKAASDTAQYVHKVEIDRTRNREIRRAECRTEVRAVKARKMTPAARQQELDDTATTFTLSSLNDNQTVDNVAQDLTLTGLVPPDEEVILVLGNNRAPLGNIPQFPANYDGFLLATRHPTGRVNIISNPQEIAVPAPSSKGISGGASRFGSINFNQNFFTQQRQFAVTTYNPTTQKAETQLIKAKDLFKGNLVTCQGQVIRRAEENVTENSQSTGQESQGYVQGVHPDGTTTIPGFNRFQGKSSTTGVIGLIFLQFFVFFVVSTALINFAQKFFRQKFSDNKKNSDISKTNTSNTNIDQSTTEKGEDSGVIRKK